MYPDRISNIHNEAAKLFRFNETWERSFSFVLETAHMYYGLDKPQLQGMFSSC